MATTIVIFKLNDESFVVTSAANVPSFTAYNLIDISV